MSSESMNFSSISLDMIRWAVFDPPMPSSYLGVRDEQTVGVLVLAGNLILRQHVSQLLDEGDHFLVPRHVSHGETAGRAFPTVRHSLQTHEHMIRSKAKHRREPGFAIYQHMEKGQFKYKKYKIKCSYFIFLQVFNHTGSPDIIWSWARILWNKVLYGNPDIWHIIIVVLRLVALYFIHFWCL